MEAALSAVERGVGAVVISSGFVPDGVLRLVSGEEV